MIKKIIISSMAFLGMSLATLYKANTVETSPQGTPLVESTEFGPIVVLELFTSQGCSSCPPADVLLDKVKKEFPNQVFALSYHVDYWNYIGWEDPFSNSAYTIKQREYTRKFKYHSNYTPQMVVNGKEHFVGSNASKLYGKVKAYASGKTANQVQLENVRSDATKVRFDYKVSGEVEGKKLRAVLVLDERTTKVNRGENRNRTLKNSNIVIAENYVPLFAKSGSSSIEIPALATSTDKMTLMVLVEADNLDITAAAKQGIP